VPPGRHPLVQRRAPSRRLTVSPSMTLHGVDALVTGAGRVVGAKDFHRDGVRFRIGDRELQAKRRRGMTRWARAVTISGPDGMWTWRHRGVLLGHRSLTRSDGVEIMRGRTRRPIKISDAATELDVAVGIASWSSGIEHQAARISVVAIFFEILSLP